MNPRSDAKRLAQFFLNFEPNPPTVTAQEKKVRIVNGKPVFYMPARLQAAHAELSAKLAKFAPPVPFAGPLKLECAWVFTSPRGAKGMWKTTKPDTDNLQKLLKDVMTRCGFWKDDALVCHEGVMKCHAPARERHGIHIAITALD